jgi:hypothetical protein
MISIALLVGFVVAYPMNWWLVANHLKHGMMTVSPAGRFGLMQDHDGGAGTHYASHIAHDAAAEAKRAPRPPVQVTALVSFAALAGVWRSPRGSGPGDQRFFDCPVHLRWARREGGLQIAFHRAAEAISNGWPLPLRRTGLASSPVVALIWSPALLSKSAPTSFAAVEDARRALRSIHGGTDRHADLVYEPLAERPRSNRRHFEQQSFEPSSRFRLRTSAWGQPQKTCQPLPHCRSTSTAELLLRRPHRRSAP